MESKKETNCTSCMHNPVCRYKDEYLKTVKKIDEFVDSIACPMCICEDETLNVPCIYYTNILDMLQSLKGDSK